MGNHPVPRCLDLLGGALQSIFDFELWPVGTREYLRVSPIGLENENAFRIGAEELPRGAVRGHVVDRNERPGSDKLIFERFLLCDCRTCKQATASAVMAETLRMLRLFTAYSSLFLKSLCAHNCGAHSAAQAERLTVLVR